MRMQKGIKHPYLLNQLQQHLNPPFHEYIGMEKNSSISRGIRHLLRNCVYNYNIALSSVVKFNILHIKAGHTFSCSVIFHVNAILLIQSQLSMVYGFKCCRSPMSALICKLRFMFFASLHGYATVVNWFLALFLMFVSFSYLGNLRLKQ